MTRAQIMLKHAHGRISSRKVTKEYRTVVLNAASMVQSSGLAQAVAFLHAKAGKEDAFKLLLDDLQTAPDIGADLLSKAATCSCGEYMRLTRLVLDQLLYLKRMAIAYYKDEKNA